MGRKNRRKGRKRRGEKGDPIKRPKTAIFITFLTLGLLYLPTLPNVDQILYTSVGLGVLLRVNFYRDRRILLYITAHNHANMTDFVKPSL